MQEYTLESGAFCVASITTFAMKNVISFSEYQSKIKSIRTPEDAAAFAKELLGSVAERPEEGADKSGNDQAVQERREPVRSPLASPRRKKVEAVISPWYDIAGNDNEAMVITLYAKGMTTRDIVSYMKIHHNVELTQSGISAITDKVFPLVKEWQARPLSSCYPVVYMDGLHFKVREAGKISPKVAYIALGVNPYGMREVLGIWVNDTEGSKFWLHVLNDMKNRGVEDIIFACVDGLRGFPEAIKAIFPGAEVQTCIVHQIRHTIMFIPHKECFCNDLKEVSAA